MDITSFKLIECSNQKYLYDIENMNIYKLGNKEFLYFKNYQTGLTEKDIDIVLEKLDIQPLEEYHPSQNITNNPVTSLTINLIQKCNLACIYCYGEDGEYGNSGVIDEQTAIKCIDWFFSQAPSDRSLSIVFFGGEPLLNFDLLKSLVKYIESKKAEIKNKIFYSITTNGTLLKGEIIEFLNKNNFTVTLSIDGGKEIQDKNRPFKNGNGSFDLIKTNVSHFLKTRNGRATARATITKNSKGIANIRQDLENIGFLSIKPIVATLPKEHPLAITTNQKMEIFEDDKNIAAKILLGIKNKNLSGLYGEKILVYIKQFRTKNKATHSCGAGRGMVAVSTTGNYYICHRFVGDDNFKMGNFNHYDKNVQKEFIQREVNFYEDCRKCWVKYHCGGGCLHDKYIINKNINKPNEMMCELVKQNVLIAIDIYSALDNKDKEFLDFIIHYENTNMN